MNPLLPRPVLALIISVCAGLISNCQSLRPGWLFRGMVKGPMLKYIPRIGWEMGMDRLHLPIVITC